MNHLLEAYEHCRQDQTYSLSAVPLLGGVILVDSELFCGFGEAVGGGTRSLRAVKLKGNMYFQYIMLTGNLDLVVLQL